MVRSGLVTAWRFAGWPTSRSPSSVKATMDGVVRIPSAFSMTFGVLPSMTATQEFVVPRSIPMTLAMVLNPLFCGRSGRPERRPKSDPLINSIAPTAALGPVAKVRCRNRFPLAHIGGRHRAARQDCRCHARFRPAIRPRIDRVAFVRGEGLLTVSRPPRPHAPALARPLRKACHGYAGPRTARTQQGLQQVGRKRRQKRPPAAGRRHA